MQELQLYGKVKTSDILVSEINLVLVLASFKSVNFSFSYSDSKPGPVRHQLAD